MEAYETKTILELEKEINLFKEYYLTEGKKTITANKNFNILIHCCPIKKKPN